MGLALLCINIIPLKGIKLTSICLLYVHLQKNHNKTNQIMSFCNFHATLYGKCSFITTSNLRAYLFEITT